MKDKKTDAQEIAILLSEPEPTLTNAETAEFSSPTLLDKQEQAMNAAKDEVFNALRKIGISDGSLDLVFGLTSQAKRREQRDEHDANRKTNKKPAKVKSP